MPNTWRRVKSKLWILRILSTNVSKLRETATHLPATTFSTWESITRIQTLGAIAIATPPAPGEYMSSRVREPDTKIVHPGKEVERKSSISASSPCVSWRHRMLCLLACCRNLQTICCLALCSFKHNPRQFQDKKLRPARFIPRILGIRLIDHLRNE